MATKSSNESRGNASSLATHRYHFISGLPRSGSTLLAAVLRQNPRFHSDMSSPVGGLFNSLLNDMSAKNEGSMFIDDAQRKRILHGLFDNFYADHDAEVVFDTNRMWCTKLPALKDLFPESKVIACVRSVSWIVDSIERLVRKNAFQPSSIFGYQAGGTVYTRANGVAGADGLVGFAFDALKEAVFGEEAPERLCLLRYESLTANPKAAMSEIYQFLGEPAFEHDFENIAYDDRGFDKKAGTPGLHEVRKRIDTNQRKTILPPDLFKRFENDAFWQGQGNVPKGIRVI